MSRQQPNFAHVNKISPPEELGDHCSQLTTPNVLALSCHLVNVAVEFLHRLAAFLIDYVPSLICVRLNHLSVSGLVASVPGLHCIQCSRLTQ